MGRKSVFWLCVTSLFLVSAAILSAVNTVKAASIVPRMYVTPLTQTISAGQTFNVTVKIENVQKLYTWGLKMRWVGDVLNVTDVVEGDFLKQGGDTAFLPVMYNGPDPSGLDADYIAVGNTLLGVANGVSGNGTLMTVKFFAETGGETVLHIFDDVLKNQNGVTVVHGAEDGYINLSPPVLSVVPAVIHDVSLVAGSTFSISINISNVFELRGFELSLKYDNTILRVINSTYVAVNTTFLPEPITVTKTVSATGLVWINATSTAAETATGNGTLATITFTVSGVGECGLDLFNTRVNDRMAALLKPSNAPALDGDFTNVAAIHDVSVKKVLASPQKVTVGQSVSVNVTVSNVGDFNETVDVTAFYDGTMIEKQTGVALNVDEEKIIQFTWDTTNVPTGVYTIKGAVSTVSGETHTTDNTAIYPHSVTVEQSGGGLPDMWLYAGVGIVIVVVVVVLVYFLRFRKSKSK